VLAYSIDILYSIAYEDQTTSLSVWGLWAYVEPKKAGDAASLRKVYKPILEPSPENGQVMRFRDKWSNQTDLGRKFGLSAIEIGKLLIDHELKDSATKAATIKAIEGGFAKSTPLRDGTPFFMWNVQKIEKIISQTHERLSRIDQYATDAYKLMKDVDAMFVRGDDKAACLTQDCLFVDVPASILDEVKRRAEALYKHSKYE